MRYVPIECAPNVWRIWDDETAYYACHNILGSRSACEAFIDDHLLWRRVS